MCSKYPVKFDICSQSIKKFHPYFELFYFRYGKAVWSSKLSKRGVRIFLQEGFCTGRISLEEGSFQGWTFQRKFYTGWICQNSYTRFLYISCFLFTDSILGVKMLRVIVWGKFSPGLNGTKDISLERVIFFVEVDPGILALFKQRSEIKSKNKTSFFNWK